jgi:hypothetical protein
MLMDNSKDLISNAEYEGWPVVFLICKKHWDLFADYKYAHLSDSEHCILCHPIENDSLGG